MHVNNKKYTMATNAVTIQVHTMMRYAHGLTLQQSMLDSDWKRKFITIIYNRSVSITCDIF